MATGNNGIDDPEYAWSQDGEPFRTERGSEQQNEDDRNSAGRPAQAEPDVPRQRACGGTGGGDWSIDDQLTGRDSDVDDVRVQ